MSDPVLYKSKSDGELWQMVTEEDRSAFAVMFYRYSGLLFKFGLTLSGDEELVKDSIQDFFIYLWDHKENIREIRSFRAYLLTAFRRFVLQAAAKREKGARALDNIVKHYPGIAEAYDGDSETGRRQRVMQEEIEKLPKRLQEIIFLRFYQGLSYDDITVITSLNYQVVRNTVHRAVKQLRSRILERTGRE